MASETLTNSEVASLLVLMAEAREISNPELKSTYGLTIDGKPRQKLNDLKLVESRKQGRAFVHVLTDGGWARCAQEFGSPVPSNGRPSAATQGALYAILASLQRHLERHDLVPAEIFEPAPDEAAPTEASVAAVGAGKTAVVETGAREPAVAPPVAASSPSDLEAKIRISYRTLVRRPGEWVGLATLRPSLGDVPRAAVDAALKRLARIPGISVVPEENQKMLSDADRAAAVTIGNQANHYLAIADA
ncbi:MAG: hypothetical protein ACQSGP_16035 [Frankia sp.]